MPIRIDHAERRAALSDAVWRIVRRDGVPAASVRGVAREAGLSMGSVRHFFGTQEELLGFAMRGVIERAGARIEAGAAARSAMAAAGRGVDAAMALLEETLPLDEERLTEARVWAAFTSQTLSHPGIAAIRQEADDGIRLLCHDSLAGLVQTGDVHAGRNIDVETERLWALIDGLTVHLLLDATRTSAAVVRTALRIHLGELQRPAPT